MLKLFSAMTGDSRYIEVMEVTEYKEVDTMCEMFDRAVNKGIEAGIKQASAIINEKEEQIKDKEEQIKDKEKQIKNKEKHRTISDERLKKPQNVNDVAEVIKLLTERGILIKEFAKKEVCDMTVAQFSRDDILKYGAREEGREEGRQETIRIMLKKGRTPEEIAEFGDFDIEEIRRIQEMLETK